MSVFRLRHAEAGDSRAVAEVVVALETALLGSTGYSLGDLEHEWQTLDLARDAWLVVDDERVVGYGALHDRGELWRIDAHVHPDAFDTACSTSTRAGRAEIQLLPRRPAAPVQPGLGTRAPVGRLRAGG